jgi:hypothetical protein
MGQLFEPVYGEVRDYPRVERIPRLERRPSFGSLVWSGEARSLSVFECVEDITSRNGYFWKIVPTNTVNLVLTIATSYCSETKKETFGKVIWGYLI